MCVSSYALASDVSSCKCVCQLGRVHPAGCVFGCNGGRISNKAGEPRRGRTCRGTSQVLLCVETLHQPHHQAEVSCADVCRCDISNTGDCLSLTYGQEKGCKKCSVGS